MFAKQLDKINSLLDRTKVESQKDSITLISTNMLRTSTTPFKGRSKTITSHIDHAVEPLDASLCDVLEKMYKAKCKDQSIKSNKRTWELFLRTFKNKNKI